MSKPMGFSFSKYKGSSPVEEKKDDGAKENDDEQKAPRKQNNKAMAAMLLLGESLPFLRKFASYKMNSKEKGTNQGEECQDLVRRIDEFVKSVSG